MLIGPENDVDDVLAALDEVDAKPADDISVVLDKNADEEEEEFVLVVFNAA